MQCNFLRSKTRWRGAYRLIINIICSPLMTTMTITMFLVEWLSSMFNNPVLWNVSFASCCLSTSYFSPPYIQVIVLVSPWFCCLIFNCLGRHSGSIQCTYPILLRPFVEVSISAMSSCPALLTISELVMLSRYKTFIISLRCLILKSISFFISNWYIVKVPELYSRVDRTIILYNFHFTLTDTW